MGVNERPLLLILQGCGSALTQATDLSVWNKRK